MSEEGEKMSLEEAERRTRRATLISSSFPFHSLAKVYRQDWGDTLLVAQATMRANLGGTLVPYTPDVWERSAIARVSALLGPAQWGDFLQRTIRVLTDHGKLDAVAVIRGGGVVRPD